MLRQVYRAPDGLVLPLQGTGTAGMETGIANLLEPGDTAIVGVRGFFGGRIARSPGATASTSWRSRPTGARRRQRAHPRGAGRPGAGVLAVVHAETSTGVEHPLAELGAASCAAATRC